jgi:hypothetical protein
VFCATGATALLAIAQTPVAPAPISEGGCRLNVECGHLLNRRRAAVSERS